MSHLFLASLGAAVRDLWTRPLIIRNPPHLVMVDLSMPVSSGETVARLLDRLNPELGVIILSVHDEKTVVDECLSAGAIGFMPEPIAVNDFIIEE